MATSTSHLDRELFSSETFSVIAHDSSFQPHARLSTTCKIVVNILDENDNRPQIWNNDTDIFIPPNVEEGHFVFGVNATDDDFGINSDLLFYLEGRDAKYFTIDVATGVVKVTSSSSTANFQTKASYNIDVIVRDQGDRSLSARKTFHVFLASEFSAPNFVELDAAAAILTIPEDTPVGETILTLVKEKKNDGANSSSSSNLVYEVAGGNLANSFSMRNEKETAAHLVLNKALDYESITEFDLWLKVYSATEPLFYTARSITIRVRDVNDNIPVFKHSVQRVRVSEGQYPPFKIARVAASDRDQGSKISYELINKNNDKNYNITTTSSDIFSINSLTGTISSLEELDREKVSSYTLDIIAWDDGIVPGRLSSTATVIVEVEDINDNAPRFTRLYSVNVTENTSYGTMLTRLEVHDMDASNNSEVTFQFVGREEEEDYYSTFKLDINSGELSVAGALDREIQDEYELRVQASDGAWKVETTVSILIIDENDNSPVFDQSSYLFRYSSPGSMSSFGGGGVGNRSLGRVHALDRDSPGPNSDIVYTKVQASELFWVHPHSGLVSLSPHSSDDDALLYSDHADNTYKLTILATDKGNPPKSSQCVVLVRVEPENRYAPTFGDTPEHDEVSIALPYTLLKGSSIFKLDAKDLDSRPGPNNEEDDHGITYKIITEEELEPGNRMLFSISNGRDVVLEDSLYGALGNIYNLIVEAKDSGTPPKSSEIKLKIMVTEENIHPPEFSTSATRVIIREDENIGSVIFSSEARDQDSGLNGQVQFTLIHGNDMNHFHIDPRTGAISVRQSLDFELVQSYDLTVKAEDSAFETKFATSSVHIQVQDVNDNIPQIVEPIISPVVLENRPRGTLVTKFLASDRDLAEENSIIEFELVEGFDTFYLNRSTGELYTLKPFDYEVTEIISVAVKVYNPGSSEEDFSLTNLDIRVQGENEYPPRFTQPVFQFVVSESSLIESPIGQVHATDLDSGIDGQIMYYFVGSSNADGFGIHATTGLIFVNEKLDRESQSRYLLNVLAKNHGNIKGTDIDQAQIIIQVQDGNDPPRFRKNVYTVSVSEDTVPGSPVVTVSAVDKDVRPRNSQFKYYIDQESDKKSQFIIDEVSGQIRVHQALDREDIDVYHLTVTAIDNGSPPSTGVTKVIVTISDVNDSAPQLAQTTIQIKENSPVGTNMSPVALRATDADLSNNAGPFKFTLLNGPFSNLVKVEPNTGVVTSGAILDREQLSSFQFLVRLEDSGHPKMQSIQNVSVVVLDENDNPSKPRDIQLLVTNYNGIFPGGVIAKLKPRDPDESGEYHCRLINGQENIFQIGTSSCLLTAGRIQNGREYHLELDIDDGKHKPVRVNVNLSFFSFTKEVLDEAVLVRFYETSPDNVLHFLDKYRRSQLLRRRSQKKRQAEITTDEDLVMNILSITTTTTAAASGRDDGVVVDTFLSFKRHLTLLPRDEAIQAANSILRPFTSSKLTLKINYDPCRETPCQNGGSCTVKREILPHQKGTYSKPTSSSSSSSTVTEHGDTLLNSPHISAVMTCACPLGYYGDRCNLHDSACRPNPCQNEGRCTESADEDGRRLFKCACVTGWGGEKCEEKTQSTCSSQPCINGGTCRELKQSKGIKRRLFNEMLFIGICNLINTWGQNF